MAQKAADQVTIVDVTDAYSVILTSEAYTFPGTTSAAKAGSTTTQVVAMLGADQVAATVTLSEITAPSGVTVTKDTDATAPTLTISVSTSVTAPGNVKIPVHIGDVTIMKTFSFGIAFTGQGGAAGKGISSTTVEYQAGASGTTAPTGAWSSTIPAVAAAQYLWTRTIYKYTDNSTSTSYSVARAGQNGSDGADAITLVVTSSNGFIFKNTSIATVLTAHVYKAGVEVTGAALTALGTIKWYKDGSSTAAATGATLTIDAGQVSGKASYTAQLEG